MSSRWKTRTCKIHAIHKKLIGIKKQKWYLITQLTWEDNAKLHRGNINSSRWKQVTVKPSYSKCSPKDSAKCTAYEYSITVIITLNPIWHRRLISANLNKDLPMNEPECFGGKSSSNYFPGFNPCELCFFHITTVQGIRHLLHKQNTIAPSTCDNNKSSE